MDAFLHKLKIIFTDASIRKRLLFVAGILLLFRVLATIPVPGIDTLQLELFFQQNQFLGLFNVFTGGGLSNLSIVMLGIGPYITASIIMQLSTVLSPRMKQMRQEEGEVGRRKFTQYSRLLTIPLAIIQALGFLALLQQQGAIGNLALSDTILNVIIITAGSVLLMWLGELISEFGIGNGVSLIIFAGIVAGLPTAVAQLQGSIIGVEQLPTLLGFVVAAFFIIWGVVTITEAERPVPITYAKQARGSKTSGGVSTYLPLRLNQTGVIPIIFALSLLLFPQMILRFLEGVEHPMVSGFSNILLVVLENNWVYAAIYFVLVFAFTYFYTAITFDPDQISGNLQKSGAFIPGIRPGQSTSKHLGGIITRLTLVGALFLGVIAVLPLIMRAILDMPQLAIGGTALLIVVSVVIDLIKKIDAQVSMREY